MTTLPLKVCVDHIKSGVDRIGDLDQFEKQTTGEVDWCIIGNGTGGGDRRGLGIEANGRAFFQTFLISESLLG